MKLVITRVGLSLLALSLARNASAAEDAPSDTERRFVPSVELSVFPSHYRYTESFSVIPVETDWSAPALGVGLVGRLETGTLFVPRVAASFLTSLSAEESNSGGLRPSDMRVTHFVDVLPGLELHLHRSRNLTAALSVDWDFLLYEQVRVGQGASAEISEAVFTHGPSAGARFEGFVTERVGLAVDYRHAFLAWGTASNSLFEARGLEAPAASGNRDVVRPYVLLRLGDSSSVRLGYRFESIRIRGMTLSNGGLEYPENDHTLHGLEIGFRITFR